MAVTTLIFDIDDTLYDVGTGFTAHRNGDAVFSFMVSKLGFASMAEAQVVRDEFFAKHHSTVKGLTVAESEGRLPAGAHFEAEMLAEWWAEGLDFSGYLRPDEETIASLRRCPLKLVAFTNGPRRYAARVLDTLGLRELFPDGRFFGVEDVMPACKPEPEAFAKVLEAVGSTAAESVMVEDSMKNIRACKSMGMRTVLVKGRGGHHQTQSEATKPGDAPDAADPAVDAVVAEVAELEKVLPQLWKSSPSWPA